MDTHEHNPGETRPFGRFLRAPFFRFLMVLGCGRLLGQEVSISLGRLHEIGVREYTYSWQLQYFHQLGEEWGGTLSWLNEGHIPDHHRDGVHLQAWKLHRIETNNLRLGLGLGLFQYFDTTESSHPSGYRNRHGLKPILSFRAQYPISDQGWEALVLINRTLGSDGPQTQGMMVGANFRFGLDPPWAHREGPRLRAEEALGGHRNELALMFGRTILNSFESESTDFLGAFSLEYRRHMNPHLDFSVAYSDEGGIDSVKRDGLAVQGWITTHSNRQDMTLAFGIGPYFNRVFPSSADEEGQGCVNVRTSLRYSMILSRTFWGHWAYRLQWDRTNTFQHADTDVLLTGLVYQW